MSCSGIQAWKVRGWTKCWPREDLDLSKLQFLLCNLAVCNCCSTSGRCSVGTGLGWWRRGSIFVVIKLIFFERFFMCFREVWAVDKSEKLPLSFKFLFLESLKWHKPRWCFRGVDLIEALTAPFSMASQLISSPTRWIWLFRAPSERNLTCHSGLTRFQFSSKNLDLHRHQLISFCESSETSWRVLQLVQSNLTNLRCWTHDWGSLLANLDRQSATWPKTIRRRYRD